MSQVKVRSNDDLLFLSRDGNTYSTVICLTEVGVTRATAEIDAKSKCGPDKIAGAKENGVTFTGQVMADPDSGSVSYDELIDFWETSQTIYWKVGKAIPAIGEVTDYGTGFISKLDKSSPIEGVITFSGAIGVYGQMSHTTATS